MVLAVRAYHRSERDGMALMGEALGVCAAEEWPGVSERVRRKRSSSKLWTWAMRRWNEKWPRLEYDIRESKQNADVSGPPPVTPESKQSATGGFAAPTC